MNLNELNPTDTYPMGMENTFMTFDRQMLLGLTQTYENDFICGYEGEDKERLRVIFLELILYVTRYVNDFRYCTNKDCPCCPETNIKRMTQQYEHEIFHQLLDGDYGLSEVPLVHIREFLKQF